MSSNTKALQEVLKYLQENRGISNNAAYKQIGLSENQGKARKRGTVEVTQDELCDLARVFPDILSILTQYGINCVQQLTNKEFREKILREVERIEQLVASIKKQVKGQS